MPKGALGPAGGINPALQLAHRHDRAAEGDRANEHRNHDRDLLHQAGGALPWAKQRHPKSHQQRRHTTAAVKQRHGFGHGSHRHPLGRNQAEHATQTGADRYPKPGLGGEGLLNQQTQHGQAHGQGRQTIGGASGAHLGEALDTEG